MATATVSPAFTATYSVIAATQTLLNAPISTDTPFVAGTFFPTGTPLAPLKPGQVINLSNLYMKDNLHGWAIEFNGHIAHTSDGGYTWQDVTPPAEVNQLFSEAGFFALDANTAWATPGEFVNCYMRTCSNTSIPTALIWRTTNAGKDWQPSQAIPAGMDQAGAVLPVHNYFPIQMQFIDQQTGWLLIDAGIRKENNQLETLGAIFFGTADGGQNWTLINDHYRDLNFPAGIFPDFTAITGFAFVDGRTGWAVAQSDLSGIRYIPVEDVVLNGALKLKKTIDGGRSFEDVPLLFPVDLSQPEYKGLTVGCGVHQILAIPPKSVSLEWSCAINTNPYTSYYLFSVSDDGGQTWHHWHSAWNESFLNRNEGWRQSCIYVSGLCALEHTVDGGVTWSTIKKVYWSVWQLDFIDSKVGWAIVFLNDASSTKGLIHTSNGGETWVEIEPKVANR